MFLWKIIIQPCLYMLFRGIRVCGKKFIIYLLTEQATRDCYNKKIATIISRLLFEIKYGIYFKFDKFISPKSVH